MTKIKICGLSHREDIDYVNEAMPDYAGFIFAPSKRRISFETAKGLKNILDSRIKAVGVFADAPQRDILQTLDCGIIDIVQLHGNETTEYAKKLKQSGCTIIKAISMQQNDIEQKLLLWEQTDVDYLLLDSGGGGTGKQFDYSLIGKRTKAFFLAGGLSPDNVESAVSVVKPYAVDLNSGVETQGFKDKNKILNAVRRVRQYE